MLCTAIKDELSDDEENVDAISETEDTFDDPDVLALTGRAYRIARAAAAGGEEDHMDNPLAAGFAGGKVSVCFVLVLC